MKARVLLIFIAVLVLGAGGLYWARSHGLSADNSWPAKPSWLPGAAILRDIAHLGASEQAKRRQPLVAVATAIAKTETFPIRRRSIGVMESPAVVIVRSRIDSQIVAQHVTDGQIVKKGHLLFTLDDQEVKAQLDKDEATLAKDQATEIKTGLDLGRMQKLVAKNAAARQQLDQAVAAAKGAAATVKGDEAQVEADKLRLSYTEIHAPISGRIGAVRVTPGNLVSANDMSGKGMVTITQLSPIRVAFTVAEDDLKLIRDAYWKNPPDKRPIVKVFTPGGRTPLASARLNYIAPTIDSASGTLTAKATFANKDDKLVPGEYVDVEIDLYSRPNAVMVPTIAVQTGPHGPFVFVVKPDKQINIQPVKLIGQEGNMTAIASGIKAGDHVVIEGQLKLEQGIRVTETVSHSDLSAQPPAGPAGSLSDRAFAKKAALHRSPTASAGAQMATEAANSR